MAYFTQRLRPKYARFCPFCGCDKLERDEWLRDNGSVRNNDDGPEFTCTVCFAGFRLTASHRAQFAAAMIRDEAKRRPPNDSR